MANSATRALGLAAAAVLVLTVLGAPTEARAAVTGAGGQFVAKLYTEALGRAPDASGWSSAMQAIQATDCAPAYLRDLARGVYTSAEFDGIGYDSASKVLALYRGVLNREPDGGGFTNYYNQLNANPGLWPAVVDGFVFSSEFANLRPAICGGGSYGFGASGVLDLPTGGGGFPGGSAAALQAALNATPPGGTVTLAERAVVRVDQPITIPPGVSLTTSGAPAPRAYARMGRLVRMNAFGDAMLKLSSGSQLRGVWVDGRRGAVGFNQPAMNVQTFGGDNVVVDTNRFSEPAGWTNFQALGTFEGFRCGSEWVRWNLITAYVPSHAGGWTDGLSIACENTVVEANHILDATDVSIVVFRAYPAVQRSVVRWNTALNAGNSAYGGYVADGLTGVGAVQSFAGTAFDVSGSFPDDSGVGGILRDVFTMGARPIANLNSLRFGDPAHPKTRHLVAGVVGGLTVAVVLIILSPQVWPGPDGEGSPVSLTNPAIISIPAGFLFCFLGTMLSREKSDPSSYHELYVRSEVGLGAAHVRRIQLGPVVGVAEVLVGQPGEGVAAFDGDGVGWGWVVAGIVGRHDQPPANIDGVVIGREGATVGLAAADVERVDLPPAAAVADRSATRRPRRSATRPGS